jgi:hypothetical protein
LIKSPVGWNASPLVTWEYKALHRIADFTSRREFSVWGEYARDYSHSFK